ncbi:MAG: anthranilate synthase component I [Micrococcales bacterium]|nr:anthranilate synthase component I [Micrococcales bacterium]
MNLGFGQTWPTLDGFRSRATHARVIPVVRRLLGDLTPVGLYATLAAGRPGTFVLESATSDGTWGRWSFVGVASQAVLTSVDGQAHWTGEVPVGVPTSGDVLDVLRQTLALLATEPEPGLPPLTGGLVGVLGWDVVRHWEPTLPAAAPDELDVPEVVVALATDLACVDHRDGSVWLVANAVNTDGTDERVDEAWAEAVARLDAMEHGLAEATGAPLLTFDPDAPVPSMTFRSTQDEFEQAVARGLEAVVDGEVFQVVLSQRVDVQCPASPLDVYRVLRTGNPSPYMYYLSLADPSGRPFAVVGSSPETLVKVHDHQVETFPIAGSRPRGATAEADAALAAELLADPKERAEHVMLVDLARNDLSKVCSPGSVDVVEFMGVRRYSHIMHICSRVTGRLAPEAVALDAFTATFPAGTLSGAPKPRAIALVDELEPARRGVYGGAVGYFDFAGNLDMAIAIRTAMIREGTAYVQAGAGIVADSVPSVEWAEVRAKAAAAVSAVQLAAQLRPAGRRRPVES